MLGTLATIVAGFFGALLPLFDTLSNFRLHLSVLLLVLAAIWSLRCSRIPALLFALFGFAGIAFSAAGLPITSHAIQPAAGEKVYRLLAMNLLWKNPTPEKVLDLIDETDPDILFLSEGFRAWQAPIATLGERYPNRYRCPEAGAHGGTVILSRLPIARSGRYCGFYSSLGLVRIELEGHEIAAGVVHLRWPWPASGPRQIGLLREELARLGPDALIAGDFNATTWSHSVGRFAEMGGLEIRRGIGPTFGPSLSIGNFLLQWPHRLGLPIDNLMSKGAVRIASARTLPPAGSDHLGVLVEFVIRP